MNLLGAIITHIALVVILVDNGYMYDSLTFWAVLVLSFVYVSTKIE